MMNEPNTQIRSSAGGCQQSTEQQQQESLLWPSRISSHTHEQEGIRCNNQMMKFRALLTRITMIWFSLCAMMTTMMMTMMMTSGALAFSASSSSSQQQQRPLAYRPLPADAAQELKDYFHSKAVREQQDLQRINNNNNNYDIDNNINYAALEERVEQLEAQLAFLLEHGIPTVIEPQQQEQQQSSIATSSSSTTTTATSVRTRTVKTFQGIPYCTTESFNDNNSNNNNNVVMDRLRQDLEQGQHMKGGADYWLVSSSSSNPHSPQAVHQEEPHQDAIITDEAAVETTTTTTTTTTTNDSVAVVVSPYMIIQQECQAMNRAQLKRELEQRNVDTTSLLEKSEFVALLVQARLQEAKEEEEQSTWQLQDNAEALETSVQVEISTDKEDPYIDQDSDYEQGTQQQTTTYNAARTAKAAYVRGMAVAVNGCNGDGIPDMAQFGQIGGGAMGGINPFVAAKVRECLANPAAFCKYYSDPDLVDIIRQLRENMP